MTQAATDRPAPTPDPFFGLRRRRGLRDLAALASGDPGLIELAVARAPMGHALIASFGGLPLLHMGDELGLPNDRSYASDPDLASDGRWMHRPRMGWDLAARAEADPSLPAGRILRGARAVMAARKREAAFAGQVPTRVPGTGRPAVLAFRRADDHAPVTCAFNFTETWQRIGAWALRLDGPRRDALSGATAGLDRGDFVPGPYAALWLRAG